MLRKSLPLLIVSLLLLALPALPLAAAVDPALLAGMRARSIGPAGMSGRAAAISGVDSNPGVVYVGGAAGGGWQANKGALPFSPLFDAQPVSSVGAIAVFQANPDVVWV